MDTYLEVEMQEELCKRLFLSFVKRAPTKTVSNVEGKVIKVTYKLIAHVRTQNRQQHQQQQKKEYDWLMECSRVTTFYTGTESRNYAT